MNADRNLGNAKQLDELDLPAVDLEREKGSAHVVAHIALSGKRAHAHIIMLVERRKSARNQKGEQEER